MDYQEKLLKILVRDIVDDFIDRNGLYKTIDISDLTEEQKLNLAIRICSVEGTFGDMIGDDIYSEIQQAVCMLIAYDHRGAQEDEIKSLLRSKIISYHMDRINEALYNEHTHQVSTIHIEAGRSFSVDEQTGEGSWK